MIMFRDIKLPSPDAISRSFSIAMEDVIPLDDISSHDEHSEFDSSEADERDIAALNVLVEQQSSPFDIENSHRSSSMLAAKLAMSIAAKLRPELSFNCSGEVDQTKNADDAVRVSSLIDEIAVLAPPATSREVAAPSRDSSGLVRIKSACDVDDVGVRLAPIEGNALVAHGIKKKLKDTSSAGPGWFDMKSPELTREIRDDLRLIRNRAALDPKRFYKRSDDRAGFPKHFQVGTVIESKEDGKNARLLKRQRKRTITEEILADTSVQRDLKRRFRKVQDSKPRRRSRRWLALANVSRRNCPFVDAYKQGMVTDRKDL